MRTVLILLLLSGCTGPVETCDFKIEYDAAQDNYWIYKCNGRFPIPIGTSYESLPDAESALRKIRKRSATNPRWHYVGDEP